MLQYLINCSAIWLLSLICFDLFLRKSTFHNANRLYLLCTFFTGLIVPLISFQKETNIRSLSSDGLVSIKAIEVKQSLIARVPSATKEGFDWTMIPTFIYWIGVFVSLCLLLLEINKMVRLYKGAVQLVIAGQKIVETHQNHGPFSFFGLTFISATKNYTTEQLAMVLLHEKRHNNLFHSLDLLIIECAKIVFWFHPLVYIYRQRLVMVHEFQADQSVDRPIAEYGSFLMEQSFVQNTPNLSHLFFHSPLKKRIIMLTRKSPTWSKCKMLLAIPVIGFAIMCCSKNAFSDNKKVQKGNKISFNGNEFELKTSPSSLVKVNGAANEEQESLVIEITPYPIKMNNEILMNTDSVTEKPKTEKKLNTYIKEAFEKNEQLFSALEDGNYQIYMIHFVTGKKGEVLYYKFDGITNTQNIEQPGPVAKKWVPKEVMPSDVKNKINDLMDNLALNISFTPAIKDGVAVPCLTDYGIGGPFNFTVANHRAHVGTTPSGIHRVIRHGQNDDTLEILDVEFTK